MLTRLVEKYADYEDEVRRLKAQIPQPANDGTIPRDPLNNRPSASTHSASGSRISNFIHSRKPTPTSSQAPTARESELQVALAREQALRQAAEAKVTEVHNEIEDLSATLFEQANEMVASERKAKAKLENRVHELEQREVDKKRRLEKLEAAMKRIERVKTLLAP